MRRLLLAAMLVAAFAVPIASSGALHYGFAQTTSSAPQSDEFNAPVFTAPFAAKCATNAVNCPDPQGPATWSLDSQSPGMLRIMSQYGDLRGTSAQASNNARNMILQPFNPAQDFTATTLMMFPAAAGSLTAAGQAAGMVVYQDDDDFIAVYRTFVAVNGVGQSQLQFIQETGGVDNVSSTVFVETGLLRPIYLQITKTGNGYSAAFSYDNATFSPFTTPSNVTPSPVGSMTATPTVTPPSTTTFTATYASPHIGLFAWGGTNTAVLTNPSYVLPADFDWFRVGNPLTPGPTAAPTMTGTAGPTATATAAAATSTAGPTSTATAAPPTATAVPTNTPIPPPPTPTPKPKPAPKSVSFKYLSLWYHVVRVGTFDHVDVQAKQHVVLGIWAHVLFPSGVHFDYYDNTDGGGHWAKTFPVPANARGPFGSNAIVAVQLWRGKHTVKNFIIFTVVR